jgi:hypothetical protein
MHNFFLDVHPRNEKSLQDLRWNTHDDHALSDHRVGGERERSLASIYSTAVTPEAPGGNPRTEHIPIHIHTSYIHAYTHDRQIQTDR